MPLKLQRGRGGSISGASNRGRSSGSKVPTGKGKLATRGGKTTTKQQEKKKNTQPKWTKKEQHSAKSIQIYYRYYKKKKGIEAAKKKKAEMEALMEEAEREAWVKLVKMEQEKAEKEYQKTLAEERERKLQLKRIKTILESSFDDELRSVQATIDEAISSLKKQTKGDIHPISLARKTLGLVDCKDANDYTPLSEAAAGGAVTVIKWLCENGADPNSIGRYGRTPLYRAAFAGHVEAVEVLLENGADPRHKVDDGNMASDIATNPAIKQILEAWDIETTEQLLGNLKLESERRATEHAEYLKKKVEAIQDKIMEAEVIFKTEEKQLISAYQELNKRIFEHDKCVIAGSHVEVTLQSVHDAEDLVSRLKQQVEDSRKQLQLLRLELREQQVKENKESDELGVKISIRELDDVILKDVGNKIQNDGRWPLILDESGQASIFIRYIDTNYVNALSPSDMQKDKLRLALLGAIRYGKPLVLDLMGLDVWHVVEERFKDIRPWLFEALLDKSLITKELFGELLAKEDGKEYESVQEFWARMGDFKFWVLTSGSDMDPLILEKFYVIRVQASRPKSEL